MYSRQIGLLTSTLKGLRHSMDKLVILLLLCSFVDSNTVNSKSVPPPPGSEQEVKISYKIDGRDAILSCRIKDLGLRRVVWSRVADPYPITIGKSRFNPDRKYRVTQVNDTFVLTIRELGLDDAGEYMCRATGAVYVADVISLNIQTGPETTHLLPTNTKIKSSIGSTVLLPCHVKNLDDKVVLWRNAENEIISVRKKTLNGDRRFKVIQNTGTEWSLRISNIQESDFGYYICVINAEPVLTRTVHLIDTRPPQSSPVLKQDTNFKTKVEVMAGETVTLTCNFDSNPPTKVQWYKQLVKTDGKTKYKGYLYATGNTYTLQSVKPEQSGVYLCYGRNGVKPSGKGRTRLIVKEPPTTVPTTTTTTTILPTGPSAPSVYSQGRFVSQKKGRDAQLTCLAIGMPRPKMHWMRHGKRLTDDHKYEINTKIDGDFRFYSTLTVRSLIDRDFGDYECYGHNYLGLTSTTKTLNESKL